MKKIVLSVCTVVAMSSLSVAGGGMKEVTPAVEPVIVVPVVEELSGFYAGLGMVAMSVRDSDLSVDFFSTIDDQERMGNVSFIAGYNFNEYIAVEGRYTTSFMHDGQVEMDGWSLFVKPQYPVSEDFSVYALLGYGGVTLDGKADEFLFTDVDDSGFQWGLGVSYMVTENISLFADYTWLANDMDGDNIIGVNQVDVDAFMVGVNYHF